MPTKLNGEIYIFRYSNYHDELAVYHGVRPHHERIKCYYKI